MSTPYTELKNWFIELKCWWNAQIHEARAAVGIKETCIKYTILRQNPRQITICFDDPVTSCPKPCVGSASSGGKK